MNTPLRHRCRQCRGKLSAPTENEHHGFCTRYCYARFYRSRCLVCEEQMQRRRENQRFKSGHKVCEAEYRKFPRAYDFPVQSVPLPTFSDRPPAKADKTGLKFGLEGHPPTARGLRDWWWGGDGEYDHSLYDRDGLTLARIVLVDGRYHLRTPVAIPRQSWPSLDEARRGAECFALMAMPLESVDPKVAARIKRENSAPHPMGPLLNRPPLTSDAISSRWRSTCHGADVPDIPGFLRRRALTAPEAANAVSQAAENERGAG